MPKPIRILHVVGAMNHGGVESWLMALLRRADRAEMAMDFLVHTPQPAAYDREIAALGGRVIGCPGVRRPRYARDFSRALREHGPYDVLHSHVHYFSGLTTTLARGGGVRLRIAHSHNDTTVVETSAGPLRACYRRLMQGGMFASATHLLACSVPAASSLFGAHWRRNRRAQVVYCGVDFSPFGASDAAADRDSARRELGLAASDLVLGHVGRLSAAKNHSFLAAIAARVERSAHGCAVLCVGAGPLEEQVRAQFKHAGVRAILTGPRGDIPRLLRAMDVFVFPSIHEGLPLAVLEAQAAGIPGVVSTEITREVDVVPGLLRWLPLSAGADLWAEEVLAAAGRGSPPAAGIEALPRSVFSIEALRRSAFSIEASFGHMRSIYLSSSNSRSPISSL